MAERPCERPWTEDDWANSIIHQSDRLVGEMAVAVLEFVYGNPGKSGYSYDYDPEWERFVELAEKLRRIGGVDE